MWSGMVMDLPTRRMFARRTRCLALTHYDEREPGKDCRLPPNDPAQQRRGPRELRVWESLHAPAGCCGAWFGGLLLLDARPLLRTRTQHRINPLEKVLQFFGRQVP